MATNIENRAPIFPARFKGGCELETPDFERRYNGQQHMDFAETNPNIQEEEMEVDDEGEVVEMEIDGYSYDRFDKDDILQNSQKLSMSIFSRKKPRNLNKNRLVNLTGFVPVTFVLPSLRRREMLRIMMLLIGGIKNLN